MNCKTDGAVYETVIRQTEVICKVYLPAEFARDPKRIFAISIGTLKKRIHDGMESALAPLFTQYSDDSNLSDREALREIAALNITPDTGASVAMAMRRIAQAALAAPVTSQQSTLQQPLENKGDGA
jgi:hypothetical protein